MAYHKKLWIALIVGAGFLFGSNLSFSQSTTNISVLQELSEKYRQKWERGRNDLYYSLLRSTHSAQVALNENPDIELMYIDERGFPVYYTIDNLNAAKTISTDDVWPGGGAGYALTGAGTDYLGIWDIGGVRTIHVEFAGRVVMMDAVGTHWHSTHVAGTMVAGGWQDAAKGMANWASLDAYDWDDAESEMATAAAAGMRVSNHSYSMTSGWHYNDGNGKWYWHGDTTISGTEDYQFGFYNDEATVWDTIAYNAPYYTIVKSAGNERDDDGPGPGGEHYVWDGDTSWVLSTTTRDPDGGADDYDCLPPKGTAKNIITVGAVADISGGYTQPSDVVMLAFSSWGPTDDGRIKPDVVGNGEDVHSAHDGGINWYADASGTSSAAPNVSGSIGLLVQHYQNTHGGMTPRSSTIKAVVVHTADEAGSNAGPDYEFGWGLMNTRKAADVIANHARANYAIISDNLHDGTSRSYVRWSNGTDPARVTLAWTDPPGAPPPASLNPATPMLVNDLDIRLIWNAGGGPITYFPYVLDPSNPGNAATTGDNTRDNVEHIYLDSPGAGQYVVDVSHKGVLASPQRFSLVITGIYGLCSGPLSDTLWPGTYRVVGDISVAFDDSLVLMPPITFLFDSAYSFTIDGTLLGEGTEDDSIIFTTDTLANPDRWRGMRFQYGSSGSQLTHCHFENGLATGVSPDNSGGGAYLYDSSPTFSNCTFANNTAENGGGVFCESNSSPTFNNCSFNDNTANSFGGGVRCRINSSPTFTNCIFARNNANSGSGVSISNSNPTFTNCTVSHNITTSGGAVSCGSSSPTFNSTIVAFSDGVGMYFSSSPGSQVEYCDFFGNSGGPFGGDVLSILGQLDTTNANGDSCDTYCNIFLDPMFVDTAAGDFHLTDDSHCIGAADPIGGPSDDIEGNPRPNPPGSNPDIGAYEHWLAGPVRNLVISISSGNAVLNWPSFGATYNIYGSADPFTSGDSLDTVTDTTWTDVNTSSRPATYFYYVTAVE